MKKIVMAIIFAILLLPAAVDARSGCCSHHGGVCGCGCCDGTSLSATCAPYYPQCSSKPAPVSTPVPKPVVITPKVQTVQTPVVETPVKVSNSEPIKSEPLQIIEKTEPVKHTEPVQKETVEAPVASSTPSKADVSPTAVLGEKEIQESEKELIQAENSTEELSTGECLFALFFLLSIPAAVIWFFKRILTKKKISE